LEIKMLIRPMPSPSNTNHEKLFVLQGGKGALNRRGNYGMAFDSKRRLAYDTMGSTPGASPDNDNVAQIAAWAKENMGPEDLARLCQMLGSMTDYVPAADDAPVVDPMQTRGRAPGARVGMDSRTMKSLDERFGLGRIGSA
jgi:hypothetical protein